MSAKSRFEVEETFIKYGFFKEKNKIISFSESKEVDKFALFLADGSFQSYEKPDAYIVKGKEVLIIEHFYIDGYSTFLNGGSKLISQEKKINQEFSLRDATREGIHQTKQLGEYNSYSGFIKNCIDRFEDHYRQIEIYKNNIIDDGIADLNSKFTVCFLMDDISPLGTVTYDGDHIQPVFLSRSKEFLNYYEERPQVNWILSSVFNYSDSAIYPYFFSYSEISECKKNTLDYGKYQFLASNYVRTDFKVLL